jgi:hypothetical protein
MLLRPLEPIELVTNNNPIVKSKLDSRREPFMRDPFHVCGVTLLLSCFVDWWVFHVPSNSRDIPIDIVF